MTVEEIWNEEHGIPTRFELARDLLECPARIEQAEQRVRDAKIRLARWQDDVADFEATLLLATNEDGTPKINGRNQEQRDAQIRTYTDHGRENIRLAEASLMREVCELERARNHFRALRSCAALIAGERE